MSRIAFLVTSLSGSGHLVRTLALARGLVAAGAAVRVVTGGRALAHVETDGVETVRIPPLTVRGRDFTAPLDAAGRPADAAYFVARAEAAARAIGAFAPDVLVTETWPLGRRRLAAEFEAAVAAARAAHPDVRLVASVRDLPEPPSKPARVAEATARLGAFDLMLVHGDARVVDLSVSWPLPAGTVPIVHTGYVAPPPPEPRPRGGAVVVGVGGGDTGRGLLALALRAARLSARPWRLRVGGEDAAALATRLSAEAPAHCTVEPAAPDWRARLAEAAAAVTLAGYNTVVDLAQTRVPALVVPDEAGGQREQILRAQAIARWPGIETARLDALDPAGLAERVERLARRPRPAALSAPSSVDLGGVARSTERLLALAGARAA